MFLLYNLLIYPITLILQLVGFFMPKIHERNQNIKKSLTALNKIEHSKKIIWFHSASMGEFEQAKPIIEFIKNINNEIQIVCTFTSPSGYNTQKKYSFADAICYIPNDTYFAAKSFINKVKPSIAIFIRYELWFNYLTILKKNNIYSCLVNATFPSKIRTSNILKPFYKNMLEKFNDIYAVTAQDTKYFAALDLKHTKIHHSSDTRIDRIIAKADEAKKMPVLKRDIFSSDEIILVAGSVWHKDIDILAEAASNFANKYPNRLRLILVPHEPTQENIKYIQNKIPDTILFSEILNNPSKVVMNAQAIIVDSIGHLLKLYGVADIAYVGGGFGVGVHSIAEPAGYGIPIAVGSNCFNSPDINGLLSFQAVEIVDDSQMLLSWLIKVDVREYREKCGVAAKAYIHSNSGATEIVGNAIMFHCKH